MMNRKLLLNLCLLFASGMVFCQQKNVQINTSWRGWQSEAVSPEALLPVIISGDKSDRQKVNSIFHWITDNIEYNVKSFQHQQYNPATAYWHEEDDQDSSAVLKPLNQRIAEMVLKRRTAVCEGYSRLFKTLCDYAGIPCEIIVGYGRTNMNSIGPSFKSNHKWNAVFFDSAWHLLDATWASGYINYRNEFERAYNNFYFLTQPKEFLIDHQPEDLRWTLMSSTPVMREYYNTPFKTSAFTTNYISAWKPQKGILEASVGDSLVFEITAKYPDRKLWVIDIPYVDSNAIFLYHCCGITEFINTVKGNTVSYTYVVKSEDTEWLSLIYDDEMILRYKLNIKKQPVKINPSDLMTKDK